MTDYLVLTTDENGSWAEKGTYAARSAESAIRKHVESIPYSANNLSYVAVPARSWKPVTVQVETKTALKFS